VQLLGCDFSSAPSAQKSIVLALGEVSNERVQLSKLLRLSSLAALSEWLQSTSSWVGAFDLPFGLPRELVVALGWPTQWSACMEHYASLDRRQIRDLFAAFCDARPSGAKFAHRATDRLAGSSPSMKWVNPPVAYMLHAGVPLLQGVDAFFPGLQELAHPQTQSSVHAKVALEAYPGFLARQVLDRRSYKADDAQRQTPDRLIARKDLIHALEQGLPGLNLRLKLTHAQRDALADDAKGDALDAVLCLMQAAWAWRRRQEGDERYGLPAEMDSLEGWIVTV